MQSPFYKLPHCARRHLRRVPCIATLWNILRPSVGAYSSIATLDLKVTILSMSRQHMLACILHIQFSSCVFVRIVYYNAVHHFSSRLIYLISVARKINHVVEHVWAGSCTRFRLVKGHKQLFLVFIRSKYWMDFYIYFWKGAWLSGGVSDPSGEVGLQFCVEKSKIYVIEWGGL